MTLPLLEAVCSSKDHGYHVLLPTREVYLKGPGMFLRGNPKKYLTEIQMLLDGGN